ncbi:MAG: autotransporter-associated beta strand repeat-containing protein, partial [Bauldia litoralis]
SVTGGGVSGGAGNIAADTALTGGDGIAAGSGLFLQGSGALAFNPGSGETTTISDAIADETGVVDAGYTPPAGYTPGAWSLSMDGAGTLILSGDNIYTGATTVAAGLLQVDGSIAGSATTVGSGGTLGGNGTTGAVSVEAGGTLAAGASAGILTTGDLAFSAGGLMTAELGGTTAGAGGYDRVVVNGTVALPGAVLTVALIDDFDPQFGDSFTIIANDGTDAVAGTFAGLAEGAQFVADGRAFAITYKGGDGNDVELTAIQAVIIGTPNADLVNTTNTVFGQLPATEGGDIIKGKAGKDKLSGAGGDDDIYGNRGKDKLFGNEGADNLSGGNAKDKLNGGKDDDVLDGGKNKDKLTGGNGDDAFAFTTKLSTKNVDKITDFGKGDDVIQLDHTIFKKINDSGELKAKFFAYNKAKDKNDHIIYSVKSGEISYDKNGSKAGGDTLFAKVDKGTILDHDDFFAI